MFIFAAISMFTMAAVAETPVKTSNVFDNTYVSLNVGASGGITPETWGYETFAKTIYPTATLRFGKWFTPTVGVEIQGEVGFGTLKVPTFVDHTYVGANAMLNVNNLWHGYQGKSDKFEVVPYAGIGWWHSYGYVTNNIATQYGIKLNWNFDKNEAWQLNVVPQITYLLSGDGTCQAPQPHFDVQRAYVGLQVGVTYKFKNHYGTRNFVLCDKKYTQDEMDKMNDEINRLRQNNDDLTKALLACQQQPTKVERVITVQEKVIYQLPKIHFEQGSSKLTTASKIALSEIAQTINKTSHKWMVLGYASQEGDSEYNSQLSLKRAEVVKKELVDMGVNSEQLFVVGKGETTQFSEECLEMNRVVEICE